MAATETGYVHGGDWNRAVKEAGLDCPPLRLDFSVNLNPLGTPPAVDAFLRTGQVAWNRYPEPYAEAAAASLAAVHALAPEQVLLGNGSTELFSLVLRVLKPRNTAWVEPCYCGYREVVHALGLNGASLAPAREDDDFSVDLETLPLDAVDLVFLASPNNPTGRALAPESVRAAARRHPRTWFVLDESYVDFLPRSASVLVMATDMPANLVVIKSLTKFFSLPGLRLGLLAAPPELAAAFRRGALPWNVNAAAAAVAPLLYADPGFLEDSRRCVTAWRELLEAGLSERAEIRIFPSLANFLYAKLPSYRSARKLQQGLLQRGLMLRTYGPAPEPGGAFCRIAVRRPQENEELIRAIAELVGRGDVEARHG